MNFNFVLFVLVFNSVYSLKKYVVSYEFLLVMLNEKQKPMFENKQYQTILITAFNYFHEKNYFSNSLLLCINIRHSNLLVYILQNQPTCYFRLPQLIINETIKRKNFNEKYLNSNPTSQQISLHSTHFDVGGYYTKE